MLIKASNIIKLPVFTLTDAQSIKTVEDVLYDPKQNKIIALLIDKGGWFSKAKVISFEKISSIGDDAVLIDSIDSIEDVTEVEQTITSIAQSDTYLTGIKILTEDGFELGNVSDIYLDTKTGNVEEFEVTQKNVRGKDNQKHTCKISDIITLGKNVAIVRVEKSTSITDQIKDTIHAVGSTVSQSANMLSQSVLHKLEEDNKTTEESNPVSQEPQTTQDLKPVDGKSKFIERRKKEAIGMYLTKNILTNDDLLLAKEGEMVTHKILSLAEINGVMDQVLDNATQRIPLAL